MTRSPIHSVTSLLAGLFAMIAIIDYQMGNLRSVQKALERVGHSAIITSDAAEITRAEKVILPGVGAFEDAIAELRRRDLIGPIKDVIAADKPFLGICLGLQLLFDVSYENGTHEGLGVLPRRSGSLRRAAGTEGAAHGLERTVDPPQAAPAGRPDRWHVRLLRAFVLREAARSVGHRHRNRLRRTVLFDDLARQSICHAIPSGKEPGGWTANSAELRRACCGSGGQLNHGDTEARSKIKVGSRILDLGS